MATKKTIKKVREKKPAVAGESLVEKKEVVAETEEQKKQKGENKCPIFIIWAFSNSIRGLTWT